MARNDLGTSFECQAPSLLPGCVPLLLIHAKKERLGRLSLFFHVLSKETMEVCAYRYPLCLNLINCKKDKKICGNSCTRYDGAVKIPPSCLAGFGEVFNRDRPLSFF